LLAAPARAELQSIDLASPGDGLVTRDSESGLEWLDLTLTSGRSVSYWLQNGCGGVPECPTGGWLANGWRLANGPELCALFDQLDTFQLGLPCPYIYEQAAGGFGWSILGTNCHHHATGAPLLVEGYYDDGGPVIVVGFAFLTGGYRMIVNDHSPWTSVGVPCNATLDAGPGTFLLRQGLPDPDPDPPAPIPGLTATGAISLALLLAIAACFSSRVTVRP
jgi:hypothetical protein